MRLEQTIATAASTAIVAALALLAGACDDAAPRARPADAGADIDESPVDASALDAGPSPPLPENDAAPAPVRPRPAPGPGFHRDGPFILDADGRVLVLHGVNTANSAKHSPDHLPWHRPEDYRALAARGLNSVRYVMAWASIMPEPGVIDEAFIDAVAERVDWAHDAGLLVILDMHQDVFGYGFQGGNGAPPWACDAERYAAFVRRSPWWTNYLSPEVMACFDHFYTDDALFEQFEAAWVAVATRFADHPAVVGFDLLNEPFWGTHSPLTFVSDIWQPRQEQLAAALHAVAPHKLAFFQGTTLSSNGRVEPFRPAADDRTALAPHYYQASVHEGGDYTPALHRDVLHALDGIGESAENLGGVPVWMGEFGGPPANPSFPTYLEDLLTQFAARRWSWAWWSDDRGESGFTLRHEDGTFKAAIIDRLGHPYARRVPGPLLSQSMDFTTGGYSARFAWIRDAPLELFLGDADTIDLTPEGGGAPIACAPDAQQPASVWRCPPEGAEIKPDFGTPYRLRLRVADRSDP